MSNSKVSRLRVNRLAAGSYSWSVSVEPADGSLAELQRAKDTALTLSRALEAELDGSSNGSTDGTRVARSNR